MSTPETKLAAARARVARAWKNCPHWDYETDGEPTAGHECCREVRAARAEVRRLRKEVQLTRAVRPPLPLGIPRMTPEDEAIVHKLKHVAFMAWLIECRDRVDFRAMTAREVYAAWHWREDYLPILPPKFVLLELGGFNARVYCETICGQELA